MESLISSDPLTKTLKLLDLAEDVTAAGAAAKWEVQRLWITFWLTSDDGQWRIQVNELKGEPPPLFEDINYRGDIRYGKKLHELLRFIGRCRRNPDVTNVVPVQMVDDAGNPNGRYLQRLSAVFGSTGIEGDWWDYDKDPPSPLPPG